MDSVGEKFLPIGSIVLLSGGTKKAMITGFCSVALEDQNKVYDYTGCVYPEGYLDFDQICLFDHDQIEKVYHLGYVDEEEKKFKEELKKMAEKFEQGGEDEIRYIIESGDDEDNIEDSNDGVDNTDELEYL